LRHAVSYWAEAKGNPLLAGVDQTTTAMQSGGNMEGKEVRFGLANTTLWATITTDASCGAVNGMHDSFTPLGGLVPWPTSCSVKWSLAESVPECMEF
jgi:K+-transporting ATPase ATPase A chain